ncbi:MAG TPA: zinc-dependent alcohol dehydrogenase [Phycisphaerales bacterium]|nr:zinc-dependent alcohol dehydrogenase [Phycisphaerales bacterium]
MKAVTWHGRHDMRVEDVPDPKILRPKDAIIKVTSAAICGSDLHIYNGHIMGMKAGDIMGHETMGEVVEVGPGVKEFKPGDRAVVAFNVACGECFFCKRRLFSACDNSNLNAELTEKVFGHAPGGIFGYSHPFGGYAGGQAQYLRVPYADTTMLKVPHGPPDEQLLFLSDILPTGYMGAEFCEPEPGDTVAVWGAGPVGQMAIRSLKMLGAERIIVIDNVPDRLRLAAEAGCETLNYDEIDIPEALRDMTAGIGPDRCLDAVGMEAHGTGVMDAVDKVKQRLKLETDRPAVLREIIMCCRKGGTVSLLGVYAGFIDKLNWGIAFNKGLQFRMGQTPVMHYAPMLLKAVLEGEVDPSIIISHKIALDDTPKAYDLFDKKEITKAVIFPNGQPATDRLDAAATETKQANLRA